MEDELEGIVNKETMSRGSFIKGLGALIASFAIPGFVEDAFGGSPADRIEKKTSPRNKSRSNRKSTTLVVYHQTEAGDESSLNSTYAQGLCNYLITSKGKIYEILPPDKVAKHAGYSQWKGKRDVSSFSVGVEVVGTHTEPPNAKQLEAMKYLNDDLKKRYTNLKDQDFVTHSMVAIMTRNGKTYRGRKWCAMYLNDPELREKMGLYETTGKDPDKLPFFPWYPDGKNLQKILYGDTDVDVLEEKGNSFGLIELNEKRTAFSIAGSEYDSERAIYFMPIEISGAIKDRIKRGNEMIEQEFKQLPTGTRMLYGYVDGGHISKERSAYSICGQDYNDPRTIYRLPSGEIKTGDKMDFNSIPEKTRVFFLDDK